jgi:hypothetical protein
MMRTPDGNGGVELSKFHTPPAVRAEPETAPANALGIRRIMFAVDDLDDVVARLRSVFRPARVQEHPLDPVHYEPHEQ